MAYLWWSLGPPEVDMVVMCRGEGANVREICLKECLVRRCWERRRDAADEAVMREMQL